MPLAIDVLRLVTSAATIMAGLTRELNHPLRRQRFPVARFIVRQQRVHVINQIDRILRVSPRINQIGARENFPVDGSSGWHWRAPSSTNRD